MLAQCLAQRLPGEDHEDTPMVQRPIGLPQTPPQSPPIPHKSYGFEGTGHRKSKHSTSSPALMTPSRSAVATSMASCQVSLAPILETREHAFERYTKGLRTNVDFMMWLNDMTGKPWKCGTLPPDGLNVSTWDQATAKLLDVIKTIAHLRDVFFKDNDDYEDDDNKSHEIWRTYFADMSESIMAVVDKVQNIKISPGKSMHLHVDQLPVTVFTHILSELNGMWFNSLSHAQQRLALPILVLCLDHELTNASTILHFANKLEDFKDDHNAQVKKVGRHLC